MLPTEIIFLIDLLASFSIYLIISLSLNLEFGYGGVPNFGKVLAVAGGAFVVGSIPGRIIVNLINIDKNLDYITNNAFIITQVTNELKNNIPLSFSIFILSIVIAAIVGAILGFIASYPAIRLREDYLGITLLAMGEILRVIGNNYPPLIGGSLGVQAPDPFAWIGGDLRFTVITFVMLFIAIIIFIYIEFLVRSPLGRALRAIRDNEIAASALGKYIPMIRMKVLMVGSAIGAIGGALYAFYTQAVIAGTYNRVDWTFWPWTMVLLGGAANNIGVALGTLIFVGARKLIIFYKGFFAPYLPFDVVWLDMLLLGTVLILVLIFKPEGIIPEKPTHTIKTNQIKKILENKKGKI
jgi:branched-chain amino acid transport system permease protein